MLGAVTAGLMQQPSQRNVSRCVTEFDGQRFKSGNGVMVQGQCLGGTGPGFPPSSRDGRRRHNRWPRQRSSVQHRGPGPRARARRYASVRAGMPGLGASDTLSVLSQGSPA